MDGGTMFRSHKFSLQTASRLVFSAALVLVAIALVSLPATAQKATPTNLTSDIPDVGTFTDANLVNPWGLIASPAGPWWVSDNGTGLSTLYDGTGKPQALVVTVPSGSSGTGTPTGIVFNSTSDFKINGSTALFIYATEDGTISGWSSGTSAVIAVNNSGSGNAVYKGLALGSAGGINYLYVANFRNGTVDVFDKNFAPFSFGSGSFVDPMVPSGFAPFNVSNLGGGMLAVTYAKQDAAKHDDVPGPGNGYITLFDTAGNLKSRLVHTPYSNSPWAVVMAPASGFGGFSGDILVGEFGSGAIAAYTPAGSFVGLLFDPANLQLRVDGVWGMNFGNGTQSGPKTTLYFAAGAFGEAHGILGNITCCSAGPIHTAKQ
jgi:uncharacterized protein (TIGR03118 family)